MSSQVKYIEVEVITEYTMINLQNILSVVLIEAFQNWNGEKEGRGKEKD